MSYRFTPNRVAGLLEAFRGHLVTSRSGRPGPLAIWPVLIPIVPAAPGARVRRGRLRVAPAHEGGDRDASGRRGRLGVRDQVGRRPRAELDPAGGRAPSQLAGQ